MTWIPNQVWNDGEYGLLFIAENRSPVGSYMIYVFFDLFLEFINAREVLIDSDAVHDIYMNSLSIYIAIKSYDVDFEMSFLWLI